MNLEQIQEMWEKDSKIDPDNLHDESLKIPQLHSKYYTLYNTITLLRERAREQYSKVRLERYNYYTGKAPAEVYVEEPFPYKVREKDAIQRHLEADDKINKVDMKIKYYDIMLKLLSAEAPEYALNAIPPNLSAAGIRGAISSNCLASLLNCLKVFIILRLYRTTLDSYQK